MTSTGRRLLASLLFLAAVTTYGAGQQTSIPNRPWPPGVLKVGEESPALSPAEALKTFYMPPGYRVELVASEPLVQDPIVMDWDPMGRMWIVEMPGFVRTLQTPEPNFDPIGRVVVLEDENGDGRMDKRTVFADNLVLPRAIGILDRGILVAEPPNVWLMNDTTGDLVADTKELVTSDYGRREARVEQNQNAFFWALDNWMHTANGDTMLRLKQGKFEIKKTLSRGEWGVTQDDAGRIYRNTNESPVHVDYVPTPYYLRNPTLLRTRGSYESFRNDAGDDVALVWPVRSTPGTNRAYQFGIRRDDGALARFTAVCAPLIYRGDRLPAELYGNVFVAEPAANLVSRIVLSDDGTKLTARKAYTEGEFLASTDERFRPVYLTNAPDGTLYIVDMYRGIIQQRADITEYLRDHIVKRKLEDPIGLGRIYRVVHETTRRDPKRLPAAGPPRSIRTSEASTDLVATLSHPNGWWRDTAQRLLVERSGDPNAAIAVEALAKLATGASEPRVRLHALWTLDGIDRIEPATVNAALEDSSRDVRVAAIRIAERWLGNFKSPVQAAVLKRLEDNDWAVRKQLAASLGALPVTARTAAVVTLFERHADDPIVMDAALSGLRGIEAAVLERLLQPAQGGDVSTPQRETAATMLAATLVRGAQETAAHDLFAMIGDERRPAWQRSALLRGAEVALLGATMPGTAGRRGAPALQSGTAPCPTCPGGRGGPGGSYAFPQAPAAPPARGPRLRLNREAVPLSQLAAGTGELSKRAAGVLARVEWPGKPGLPAPVAPLTAEEQQRYVAGAEIYKNVCQACHQPDGRGQEKLANSLIDSVLALAPADITVRILINGKEGSTGLMPPLGSTLSDEQVASVLTYIRREWGQDGSPVAPGTVRDVRAATASRTRPWTHEELLAMVAAAKGGG